MKVKKIPKPRTGDVLTAINRAFSEGYNAALSDLSEELDLKKRCAGGDAIFATSIEQKINLLKEKKNEN